jgi:hypothetical protein
MLVNPSSKQALSYILMSRHVDEYLSDEQLLNARNLKEFAGILAFDKWLGNSDARQVVYRRCTTERGHRVVFIDQGGCFNLGQWNFRDAPLKGVFAQNGAYLAVTGWDSFEPWLSRIEQFNPQSLWEIAEAVPTEWYEGDISALDELVEKMISRRWRVRELIDQFRQSSRIPFPKWKNHALPTLPDQHLRYRRKEIYNLTQAAVHDTSAPNGIVSEIKTA